MISTTNLGALMGAPVFGPDDEKIGTVGQIFVDPDDGHPNWMTVHTGIFGRHETFVPLDNATWDHERVHVEFDKDVIKGAPRLDVDAPLAPEDEAGLYRYCGLDAEDEREGGIARDRAADSGREREDQPISDSSVADERAVPDDAQPAGTQQREVETGRARLRKYDVTEQKTVTVPVSHEEVRVESEDVGNEPGADADASTHSLPDDDDDRPTRPRHAM